MINILYNDLKTLISSSILVPEEQYRITDYVTTVSKANYSSAGYKFDIVVTALTTNTLYEYATLMSNETETYFDANALLLYNIKYNVNNVIPGYYNDWVDANGKGCIYYMVDDKGNEAPFDFKNIKFYGNFLFNSTYDGSDTSQTISEYNSIKEVIEDDTFIIPQISFVDACSGCTIGTNAGQLMITECSNLQIGDNCKNCEITNVNDTTIGIELSGATLTSINGAKIGDNCNTIEITNQTNLILGNNNTTITIGSGGNGIIIDSNNTNILIGINANGIYINDSNDVKLANNIEQFNLSSCYNINVTNDCKLFTLTETNHLTASVECQSINCNSNSYIVVNNYITNVTVSEGLTNLVLDGSILSGNDSKTIIQQDEKVVVINDVTNDESVLQSDGTTTPVETIDFYKKYTTITSTVDIKLFKEFSMYKYTHTSGNITSFNFDSSTLINYNSASDYYTFEMEIIMPSDGTSITFPSTIVPINGTSITLQASKKNYLEFKTYDGINFIVKWLGYLPTIIGIEGNFVTIAYGNGTYVALAENQTIGAYSKNRINWNPMTLPHSLKWDSVAYGNGKFLAIANGSNLGAYSTDGINWTSTTLPDIGENWYDSLCYADWNGKFVAIQNTSDVVVSSIDGINWNTSTLPFVADWYDVSYGGGKFVAVNDGENYFAYSTDAINWYQSNLLPISAVFKSVDYNPLSGGGFGKWIAVGTSVNYTVLTSTDGIDWDIDLSATNSSKNKITAGVNGLNGHYIVTNGTINYEYFNDIVWETKTFSKKAVDSCFDGTNFVTVGSENNKLVTNVFTPPNDGWTSSK